MTAEATSATVLGRFDGATLSHAGVVARMDRDAAGGFRMTFTRGSEPPRAVAVARTVGSRRYQQYLAKEGDTYWRLPVAWHVEEKRWFPMTGAFLFSSEPWEGSAPPAMGRAEQSSSVPDAIPGRPVFGGGVFDRHVTRWNDNCVFCHNVAPDPGLDVATGTFRTRTAELGIACEACHGPGAEHARASADPLRRFVARARKLSDATIVNPSRLSPARAADVCGRCHGQRLADDVAPFLAHGDPFVPGDALALYTAPLWRDTPLGGDPTVFAARFWADGTPRLTAYEYQGLLQSRCAQRGALTCTTCHGMHEGDPRGQIRAGYRGAAADAMCTRCHTALADTTASARHSHHDAAGAGGRCVACHMPRIVYGVLDVHRSHRIEVPEPARAAAQGRPDACTGCHVSETPAWAAAARARLWGRPAGDPAPVGSSTLDELFAGDPIGRAVAADALGRVQAPLAPDARAIRRGALLDTMVGDPYPAVRHLAWRALGRLTPAVVALEYDPSAEASVRGVVVSRLRARLGPETVAPVPGVVAALRARGRREEIEIGE
jgi:predicted CXXCH cytochrome family protein